MSLGQDESVAAPEATEEDEESQIIRAANENWILLSQDLPLEELAKSEGSGEAETKDAEAEPVEQVPGSGDEELTKNSLNTAKLANAAMFMRPQAGSMEVDTAAAEDLRLRKC